MLLRLLELEWKKYKNHSLFRLLLLFYICALPLALYAWHYVYGAVFFNSLTDQIDQMNILAKPDNIVSFHRVWEHLAYCGNWVTYLFISFISIFIVTTEVSYKTMRQNIINGGTRQEFFLGKLMVILAVSIFCTIIYVTVALGYGLWYTESYSSWSKGLDAIPRYFLMVLNYLSFGLMLGAVIRKAGLAIFSYLAYTVFGESLLRVGYYYLFQNDGQAFFPLNTNEDLSPWPLYKFAQFIPDTNEMPFHFKLLSPTEAIVSSSIYTIIYLAISYWSIMKRDL